MNMFAIDFRLVGSWILRLFRRYILGVTGIGLFIFIYRSFQLGIVVNFA